MTALTKKEKDRKHYLKYHEQEVKRKRAYCAAYGKSEAGKMAQKRNSERRKIVCPEKLLARSRLRHAIASGKIIRQPCEVCGNPKTEAHHDDYSKPLEVRWLCHQHHLELEGRWLFREEQNENKL